MKMNNNEADRCSVENHVNNGLQGDELSLSLQVIQEAVVSGQWSDNALETLNSIVDRLENGELIYNRGLQETARGLQKGGRILASAVCILGAEESSGRKIERSQLSAESLSLFDRQSQALEAWSRAAGVWVEGDIKKNLKGKYGDPFASASESDCYDGGSNVIKAFEPGSLYDEDIRLAIDRIIISNVVFPEAVNRIVSIGRTYYGQLIFVIKQPYLPGEPATKDEISDYFVTKRGMIKESSTSFCDEDIVISDMKIDNVVKVVDTIIAFDGNFAYNEDSKHVNWSFTIGPSCSSILENEISEAIQHKSSIDDVK